MKKDNYISVNADKIVAFIMKNHPECYEFEDLNEEFVISGYYLGFINNKIVLYMDEKLYSVHLRPYHVKFLMEKNPVVFQRISLKSEGLQKGKKASKSHGFHPYYFHINIDTHIDFFKIEGFEP